MVRIYLNGNGDLGIDPEIRPYIDQVVDIVKRCKSGLYQIRTSDLRLFSVPKSNLFWKVTYNDQKERP